MKQSLLDINTEYRDILADMEVHAEQNEGDVTGFPLGVGLFVGVNSDAPVPFIASTGLTASMTGPNGFELDAGEVCGLCISGGFGYRIGSGSGDPRVTAGTYTAHVESTASGGARVQPFAVYLER